MSYKDSSYGRVLLVPTLSNLERHYEVLKAMELHLNGSLHLNSVLFLLSFNRHHKGFLILNKIHFQYSQLMAQFYSCSISCERMIAFSILVNDHNRILAVVFNVYIQTERFIVLPGKRL